MVSQIHNYLKILIVHVLLYVQLELKNIIPIFQIITFNQNPQRLSRKRVGLSNPKRKAVISTIYITDDIVCSYMKI